MQANLRYASTVIINLNFFVNNYDMEYGMEYGMEYVVWHGLMGVFSKKGCLHHGDLARAQRKMEKSCARARPPTTSVAEKD